MESNKSFATSPRAVDDYALAERLDKRADRCVADFEKIFRGWFKTDLNGGRFRLEDAAMVKDMLMRLKDSYDGEFNIHNKPSLADQPPATSVQQDVTAKPPSINPGASIQSTPDIGTPSNPVTSASKYGYNDATHSDNIAAEPFTKSARFESTASPRPGLTSRPAFGQGVETVPEKRRSSHTYNVEIRKAERSETPMKRFRLNPEADSEQASPSSDGGDTIMQEEGSEEADNSKKDEMDSSTQKIRLKHTFAELKMKRAQLEQIQYSYYGVLGVPSNAHSQTIRKAYFGLVDKYGGDCKNKVSDAITIMTIIKDAYDTLRNPTRRERYDRRQRRSSGSS